MSFRRMSGIRLPYRRQGLIYFTLLSYEDMGKKGKNGSTPSCSRRPTARRPSPLHCGIGAAAK